VASSKKSCPVKVSLPPTCTLTWMCTARPGYQPGTIVANSAAPSAAVIWTPRQNVSPVAPSTPEYAPAASQCHTSTAASFSGVQASASTTLTRSASGVPGRPSAMSLRMLSRSR
jgi:hypothetical protein